MIKIAKELEKILYKIASDVVSVNDELIGNLKKMFLILKKNKQEIVITSFSNENSDKENYTPNVEYMFEFKKEIHDNPKQDFSFNTVMKEDDLDFLKDVAKTVRFSREFSEDYFKMFPKSSNF